MHARTLAVGLLSLAVLLADHRAASAQSTDSSCAILSIGIVTNAATVFPGSTIGIGGRVRNCSSKKARWTLVVSDTSSCGQKAEVARSRLVLGPAENTTWAISYPMPAVTCSGIWEATAQLDDDRENGGSAIATGMTTVIVE